MFSIRAVFPNSVLVKGIGTRFGFSSSFYNIFSKFYLVALANGVKKSKIVVILVSMSSNVIFRLLSSIILGYNSS